jgi:hypothetical protein
MRRYCAPQMSRYSKIPAAEWAAKNDAQIARDHGGTKQGAAHHRKTHKLPATPSPHGGRRHGEETRDAIRKRIARLLRNRTAAELRAAHTALAGLLGK